MKGKRGKERSLFPFSFSLFPTSARSLLFAPPCLLFPGFDQHFPPHLKALRFLLLSGDEPEDAILYSMI
jgi:hypothetical protein